jgi:hypothetical protein
MRNKNTKKKQEVFSRAYANWKQNQNSATS